MNRNSTCEMLIKTNTKDVYRVYTNRYNKNYIDTYTKSKHPLS